MTNFHQLLAITVYKPLLKVKFISSLQIVIAISLEKNSWKTMFKQNSLNFSNEKAAWPFWFYWTDIVCFCEFLVKINCGFYLDYFEQLTRLRLID